MDYDYAYYQASADYVKSKIDFTPEIALILGTALGGLTEKITDKVVIPYADIPNFLSSTAPSHAGELVLGKLGGKYVACMSGRFHYYEGYAFEQLTAPIRLFHLLGAKASIVTNAAGAVNLGYRPGDVMIIHDHINLMGVSPTRGKNIAAFGERFFDVSSVYTPALRDVALACATRTPLHVHQGVYYFFCGPQFETPAEIRAVRMLGADAVGMSTVPEALTAAHCKMPLLGISLMVNMGAGISSQPLSGEEVDETAQKVSTEFCAYVEDIVAHIDL
ncbi:purine-nucleoside phosphorylase [Christensenellaceae bacterium OttesenSCG-928-L17]|nr:purine-nucleoside phosphorylase [Christensenellaceae bacterium OttesenSCG-928-L17]